MARTRRALHVITRLNIGGAARHVLSLTKGLRPDYQTTLVAGEVQEGEGELTDPDVEVRRTSLGRPLRPLRDWHAYRDLRRLVDEGFDLVHTHMAKAGAVGRRAALASRTRPVLVHTFHGHVLEGYFSRPMREVFLRTERWLADRTDMLVAVSDQTRDELLALGIGSPERWCVIPLGCDLEPMLKTDEPQGELRSSLGIKADIPLVGVLGRLAPIKDHVTLIDAIARLEGVHLAILGDGELREKLGARVTSLGLVGRVHFAGWRLDVADAISDMDVVALTSRNEGTPVSLIEASAAAKPVVATDVGGVRAVVQDGLTGLVVPQGDAAAVATAVDTLLRDREGARKMGRAGREYVRQRFTNERLLADIRSMYDTLLERKA